MKLKSLPLNNLSDILYIERYAHKWCKLYYADRHIETYGVNSLLSFKALYKIYVLKSDKNKYLAPMCIGNQLFSPTKNIKDKDCAFFNLLKVDQQDPYYDHLLSTKDMLEISRKRYLKHKENELFNRY